jgi:hypothetical protein
MWNFRSLLLVRVRSIFLSRGCQHQNAFSCSHSSEVVRKGFGICIPITYVPLRNGPDKSRQVLLRQAAENPDVVRNAGTAVVTEVGTSLSKTSLSIGTIVGSVLATMSGCCAMFGAFSYFSALGNNVADLKDITTQMNARMDAFNARFDAYNARFDAYDARFDKVYVGTVSISLGLPVLLMIGLCVLKEKGK